MRLTVQGPDSLLQFYLMPDATNEAQQDEKEIGKNVQHAVMALDLKSELNVAREEREREHKPGPVSRFENCKMLFVRCQWSHEGRDDFTTSK